MVRAGVLYIVPRGGDSPKCSWRVTAGLITTALALTASALVEGSWSRDQGGRHPGPSHPQNSDLRQLGPLGSPCWPALDQGVQGVLGGC